MNHTIEPVELEFGYGLRGDKSFVKLVDSGGSGTLSIDLNGNIYGSIDLYTYVADYTQRGRISLAVPTGNIWKIKLGTRGKLIRLGARSADQRENYQTYVRSIMPGSFPISQETTLTVTIDGTKYNMILPVDDYTPESFADIINNGLLVANSQIGNAYLSFRNSSDPSNTTQTHTLYIQSVAPSVDINVAFTSGDSPLDFSGRSSKPLSVEGSHGVWNGITGSQSNVSFANGDFVEIPTTDQDGYRLYEISADSMRKRYGGKTGDEDAYSYQHLTGQFDKDGNKRLLDDFYSTFFMPAKFNANQKGIIAPLDDIIIKIESLRGGL